MAEIAAEAEWSAAGVADEPGAAGTAEAAEGAADCEGYDSGSGGELGAMSLAGGVGPAGATEGAPGAERFDTRAASTAGVAVTAPGAGQLAARVANEAGTPGPASGAGEGGREVGRRIAETAVNAQADAEGTGAAVGAGWVDGVRVVAVEGGGVLGCGGAGSVRVRLAVGSAGVAHVPAVGGGSPVVPEPEVRGRVGFVVTAEGAYGACLARVDAGWVVERWALDTAEPYAVVLPGGQPEEAGTAVSPLADGRVLVVRAVADRYDAVLLYPAGPGTGETRIASLPGGPVRLAPPAPDGRTAYVLRSTGPATELWQVVGAPGGEPALVMTIDGHCSGGVWLDRTGRLLALDRERDGRTKTVTADLHTGATTPLLHITDDSDDRLVLAEPDSGLLVLRSDAAGTARLGWGVLGSRRPVRFPDALCVAGAQLSPVAAQPGQILSPESVLVALRAEAPGGAEALALWRPGERHVHWRAAPAGWLGGAGAWRSGELVVPYAGTSSGFATYGPPEPPALPPGPATAAPRPRIVKEPRRPKPTRRALSVLPLQQSPLSTTRR